MASKAVDGVDLEITRASKRHPLEVKKAAVMVISTSTENFSFSEIVKIRHIMT